MKFIKRLHVTVKLIVFNKIDSNLVGSIFAKMHTFMTGMWEKSKIVLLWMPL